MIRTILFDGDWTVLGSEIDAVTLEEIPAGSGSSHFGGPEAWIEGGFSNRRISVDTCPTLGQGIAALREHFSLGPVTQIMINELAAGFALKPHKDGLPDEARYHLPIVTHGAVRWWDQDNGDIHMVERVWYGPMPHCGKLHSVSNFSPIDRVHVVVDFKQ